MVYFGIKGVKEGVSSSSLLAYRLTVSKSTLSALCFLALEPYTGQGRLPPERCAPWLRLCPVDVSGDGSSNPEETGPLGTVET